MQIKELNKIQHRERLLILGHGPSVDKLLRDVSAYRAQDIDVMSLNDWYNMSIDAIDFQVCTNISSGIYPTYKENIRADTTYFWAREFVPEGYTDGLEADYFLYQWHDGGFDLTKAFEEKYHSRVSIGDSTIIVCLLLATLMEYKRIYYIGVELDARLGYGSRKGELKIEEEKPEDKVRLMDYYRPKILNDIQILKNAAPMPIVDMTHMSYEDIRKIL